MVIQGLFGFEMVNERTPWNFERVADAEQEKQTGGMIALYPREDDAYKLAVSGGEPVEDLHCTLAFLGKDVSGMDPTALYENLPQMLDSVTVITARIMGHALFNPDGGPTGEFEPCAVYLIGDSTQIPELHSDVSHMLDRVSVSLDVPSQHSPFIPHITAGYSLPIDELKYTGSVLFDRVGLAWDSQTHFFPLMGSTL